MTQPVLHRDRRLQRERTALAGGAAVVVAVDLFGPDLRRRRELAIERVPATGFARRDVICVAGAVVIFSVALTTYLLVAHR